MHPVLKALIAWCAAGYCARLVSRFALRALYGAAAKMFAFPDIIFDLMRGVTWLPLSVALCLGVYVTGLLIRKAIGRFSPHNPDLAAGLGFTLAIVLGTLLMTALLGREWSFDGVMGEPVAAFTALAPYGMAAFGVYWKIGRDPARPYGLRVF